MKRTLNYTGRGSLSKADLSIELAQSGASIVFHWSGLLGHEIEQDVWSIYADVKVKNYFHRLKLGGSTAEIVTEAELPGLAPSALTEGERINATFKVVDESGARGRIIRQWSGLIAGPGPNETEEKKSLLHVRVTTALGDVPWRLELDDEPQPVLCVNSKVPSFKGRLTADPLVRALVIPQCVELILRRCLTSDFDDPWATKWLSWATNYTDLPAPTGADEPEVETWVVGVVESFCQKEGVLSRLMEVGE